MRSSLCSIAPPLKSVVRRDDHDCKQMFALCDSCWFPIREAVWIVPGWLNVWGRCRDCGEWESVNDLRAVKPGEPVMGVCGTCSCGVGDP